MKAALAVRNKAQRDRNMVGFKSPRDNEEDQMIPGHRPFRCWDSNAVRNTACGGPSVVFLNHPRWTPMGGPRADRVRYVNVDICTYIFEDLRILVYVLLQNYCKTLPLPRFLTTDVSRKFDSPGLEKSQFGPGGFRLKNCFL